MGVQRRQPTGIPRPHQWLLMGVQACRLPAPKPLKPSKPSKPLKPKTLQTPKTIPRPHQWQQASQGHINGFSWAYSAGNIATRRPDPSRLLGGPACRSPGIRSQQASQGHINGFLWASKLFLGGPACHSPAFAANRHPKATSMASYGRLWASSAGTQQASQGHINGFLWASKLAVCQPLNP